MGIALKEQGKPNEAIEVLSKALAIKPDYADAHYHISVTLHEQGRLEEAVRLTTKPSPSSLIMLMPTTTWAMLSKSKTS